MPPCAERHDVHGRLSEVLGPLGRRGDHRDRAVGLQRVVEEAQRVGDHAGGEVLVERERLRAAATSAGGSRSRAARWRPRRSARASCRRGACGGCVSTAKLWPGEISPELAANAMLGGERPCRRRGCRRRPPPPPPPATALPAEAPRGLLQRHQRDADLGHAADWIAAAASPSEPAEPPPPEVSEAAKRTSGTPSTDGDQRRVARVRVDREAVEVVDRRGRRRRGRAGSRCTPSRARSAAATGRACSTASRRRRRPRSCP